MGRTGVTLPDVERAVAQLQGRGKNPTVDAIRAFLGTGSKSTITQHLNAWKSKSNEAQGKLPHDLLALVTGLWERLNGQAEQRIIDIEALAEQQTQALKQTLCQLQREQSELKTQYHQLEETLSIAQANKTAYEKQLQLEQQEHAKLRERHQVTIQQLDDHKAENIRLHQLATHIQANLEHYQNAMQEARIEQNLIIEKQQTQFHQELIGLQHELSSLHLRSQESEQQLIQKTMELKQVTDQSHLLDKENNNLKQQLQENSNELIILRDRSEQNQQQLNKYQVELEHKDHQLIDFKKQIAVLNDNHERLKISLSIAENKIELLRDEKSFLSHEKAQIAGHLNQLEKMKLTG